MKCVLYRAITNASPQGINDDAVFFFFFKEYVRSQNDISGQVK
jgi:hypothetical protein